MTNLNEVLRSALENFPIAELAPGEQQAIFDKVKNKLIQAPSAMEELRVLYRVNGFSDFAVVLMWIVERAGQTSGALDFGPAEETLLLSSFRGAIGDSLSVDSETTVESGVGDQRGFSTLVEEFVEAIQSGAGGSRMLLEDLIAECEAAAQQQAPEDFKTLCALLPEFLNYIAENQLLEDVRVINILSNFSSSLSQWASTPPASRSGMLEEALSMLRDFKSHFE